MFSLEIEIDYRRYPDITMKVGLQVLELDAPGKSSIYLLEEALERECSVFIYPVKTLCICSGRVFARGKYVESCHKGAITLSKEEIEVNLDTLDLLLMRNDPPFNMDYITATYILERSGALVVNNPVAVRNFPEKFVDYYEDTFPTLISRDIWNIKLFIEQYREVVVKPLYAFAGIDVTKISNANESTLARVQSLIEKTGTPVVIQKYDESVIEQGDKRVVVLNGGLLGCLKRHNKNSFITNLRQGGEFFSCTLTPIEEERCYKIASDLKESGIILAGIDLVAGRITEINVTSTACIAELNELYHINTAARCFDVFEEMVWSHKR
ncbi:glutathione synthetase [Neorickettsia sennetsu str. Miyayama]|uniref:Glutathione synthetase n=1 Tax=Ehrlichia sennetsu (strain ATCC VR-367 / Miyayama) TaxID=222891 RepID=Q2GEL5_EHRS3|nr:glutathione synthetase [Neorickettsia sennetsu str. Miyayama]